MKKAALILALSLSACTLPTALANDENTLITGLVNKAISDLQSANKFAVAAGDTDGSQCFVAGIAVATNLQSQFASLKGQTIGVITQAEVLSVIGPGSPQWNTAVKTVEAACIAKLHDVNQQIAAAGGSILAPIAGISQILALPAVAYSKPVISVTLNGRINRELY